MKKILSITIDADLLSRIKEQAKTENRTVSNLFETAIRAYMAK